MARVKQFCAECNQPMQAMANGAYARCCNGLGYWADVPPCDGYKLPARYGLWPYIRQKKQKQWPKL